MKTCTDPRPPALPRVCPRLAATGSSRPGPAMALRGAPASAPPAPGAPALKGLLALLAGLLLAGCAGLKAPAADPIPAPVREALRAQGAPAEALAFVAFPLDAPGPTLAWQADRPMLTASTMKTLTGIVALDRLGPNWRGRTEVLAAGPLQDGVLDGPLVLRGGADATLDWNVLHGLLRQVREAGVREVRGGLRIDRQRFRPAREDVGAPPFDEAPEFPYNSVPDALNLNASELGLRLSSQGEAVTARWSPAWPGLQVDASAMRLVERPCPDWDEGWKPARVHAHAGGIQVTLAGEFPRQCQVLQPLNLLDRQQVAALALRQLWQELGGTLAGEVVEGATPEGARPLALHLAPPLAEWLRSAMKRSDNPLTRLLFLELGATHPQSAGFATTREAAGARVREWLREQGIDASGLVTENGSGLSRHERFSPALIAAALRVAAAKPYAQELGSALPLAGRDGTLTRRLRGTPAEGRAWLKTGTLRDAAGLVGYLTDARQRRWVVAALFNGDRAAARGRPVLDALMAHLAGQP